MNEHSQCTVCDSSDLLLVDEPDLSVGRDCDYEVECQRCGLSRHYSVEEIDEIGREREYDKADQNNRLR